METKRTWTELWKLAMSLEKDIDCKLLALSKIESGHRSPKDSERESLLGPADKFEVAAADIQHLLNELSSVADEMSQIPPTADDKSEIVHTHTLDRLQEILSSYQTEFKKTEKHYRDRKDREDLFGAESTATDPRKLLNRRMDFGIKENEYIRSSTRLVDEQIAIAMDTREHLGGQRVFLKRVQTRMNDLANRFPAVNSLIQRINNRKTRNSLILGIVAAVCMFLLLASIFF